MRRSMESRLYLMFWSSFMRSLKTLPKMKKLKFWLELQQLA